MKIERVSDENDNVIGWRITPDSGNAAIVFKDQALMPGVRDGDFVPRLGGRIVSEVVYCGRNGCVHEAKASGSLDAAFVYDEPADLMTIVEQILDVGHMDTTDLGRLRAAWERSRPDDSPARRMVSDTEGECVTDEEPVADLRRGGTSVFGYANLVAALPAADQLAPGHYQLYTRPQAPAAVDWVKLAEPVKSPDGIETWFQTAKGRNTIEIHALFYLPNDQQLYVRHLAAADEVLQAKNPEFVIEQLRGRPSLAIRSTLSRMRNNQT